MTTNKIDLKALRAVATEHLRNSAVGTLAVPPITILALLDRLEAAELERDELKSQVEGLTYLVKGAVREL